MTYTSYHTMLLGARSLPTTQRNAPVKGILMSDPTHFPISFNMLVSMPNHLGEKREREEKKIIYQRYFYLLLLTDLVGKFFLLSSIILVHCC